MPAIQYTLNEEQRQSQDLARRVAREEVAPRANGIDRTEEYKHDMFDLLKQLSRNPGIQPGLLRHGAPVDELARSTRWRNVSPDTTMKVATDAVQLFGTATISAEHRINRDFRGAKVLQIIEETNQIQANITSHSLLGRPTKT